MVFRVEQLLLCGLVLGQVATSSATAQVDYRNLDDGRPVLTEDAYPVERYAFELLAPYSFEKEHGGRRVHVVAAEVETGLFTNTQVGLRTLLAATDGISGTDWGLAGLSAYGLYNFNTEGRVLPAFALRTDVTFPVGSLAGNRTRVTAKAIATRSWGVTRFHVNVARTFGSEVGVGPVDAPNRWFYSFAADRTFFRSSVLLVGEVAAARLVKDAPTEVNAALGVRYQWSPTSVIDVGISRRLRNTIGPDYALTFGLSHAFAIGAFMPAGPR